MERPEVAMTRSYRRRASQHGHWLSQEEIPYYDSSKSKSISREPTPEESEVEEEEEEQEDEEEEEEDEELAPESSMEHEKELFARHRENWEFSFGYGRLTFDRFTSFSSMVFTHCTPSCLPHEAILATTLQMCSIKVAKIKHLEWPLQVFGLITARDFVDHKRNIIFYRPRRRSQTLTKKEPYLNLTGPRRGLLSVDDVHVEIQLSVKGQSIAEDKTLVRRVFRYYNPSNSRNWCHCYLTNHLCKIELCLDQLSQARQATVLSVRVTRGTPFRYGGQVLCSADEEEDPSKRIVLFDSKYGTTKVTDSATAADGTTMPMDPDGFLDLSRRVVSVQGRLKFFINTYSRSGAILASGRASFRAKDCQTSQAKCTLHNPKASKGNVASKGQDQVKIHVAWSLFARKISSIELDCFGGI